MFDSFGTLSGIMERCGFLKGDPQLAMTRVNRGMCVDGLGLVFGALIGSNSITCFVESNTGVEAGARTGVASMITGAAFLLSLLFVQPFVGIIPDAATTCALVMVGVHSISALKDVNFEDFTDQLTAFFTIATMEFTYSVRVIKYIYPLCITTVTYMSLLLSVSITSPRSPTVSPSPSSSTLG
jgi:AGZA family xanthine/uracil permease-like MFS transporter